MDDEEIRLRMLDCFLCHFHLLALPSPPIACSQVGDIGDSSVMGRMKDSGFRLNVLTCKTEIRIVPTSKDSVWHIKGTQCVSCYFCAIVVKIL